MLGTEHLKLAEAAFGRQAYAEAIAQAQQALAAGVDSNVPGSERGEYWEHPETSQCELIMGMALHESGRSDAALPHLDRAVDLDRENSRPWANRGHVRRARAEYELALADLSYALKRSPSYGFARFRRAQCYVDLGRPSEAEQDLELLLIPNPYDAAPLALWQSLREQRGAPPLDAGRLPTRDWSSLFGRACVFMQHAEPARALVDFDTAYALAPQPLLRFHRASAHRALGNLEAALADLEAYAAADPNSIALVAPLLDVRTRLAARGR